MNTRGLKFDEILDVSVDESKRLFVGLIVVDGADDVNAGAFHLNDKRGFADFVIFAGYFSAVAVEQADVAIC